MLPLVRSRPLQLALAVVAALLFAAGFLPLFGGPGYESAVAAGIVLPFAVAVAVALDLSSRWGQSPQTPEGSATAGATPKVSLRSTCPTVAEPSRSLARGVFTGAVFAFVAWLTTLIHGLRTGFCDALGGSAHFALGAASGALLAGAWGALVGEIARGRRRRRLVAVLLAIAGPLASIAFSVGRFVTSPIVYAYDPFVGYFSGVLYDTVIDFSGLVSYRAGTACSLVAVGVLALHLHRDERGRLRLRWFGRPGVALLGAGALVGSIALAAEGDRLRHWQTPSTIARELGARTAGRRCEVIHPRGMRPAEVERFLRDCDGHVAAGERYFEIQGPPTITVYLFADSAQKAALMGAADTYIAKPWRREVYVQAAGYPHNVLGHELMHVLAGSFGRGPFRIAGSLGGLLPNPGLVEGVAVAGAPPEGDLTPRQWAKAMKDLGLLPPLERLFALGFLGENASLAYTVSGAFVSYVHDRFGASALKSWYGGAPLPDVAGHPWAEIERDFRADLDAVELPEAARAQAKARFDRPAIFGRRCPHRVDACKVAADRLRSSGDDEGAIAKYEEVLGLDPGDSGIKIALAKGAIRLGRVEEGARELERLAADGATARHVRDRALEELGDLALAAGKGEVAIARYREVMERTVEEDALRTLEVKIAAAEDERARPALLALLIGVNGRGPDKILAVELLSAWSAADPQAGLPQYLVGRHYLGAGQLEEAASRLDRALAGRFAIERVQIEAERLRMIAACGLGDAKTAATWFQRYAAHPLVSEARRAAAARLVERCGPDLGH